MCSVSWLKFPLLVIVCAVGWQIFQSYCTRRLPPVVEGFFLPQYRPVADLFRKYVEDGTEEGASFAVYHRGEKLINLWGGYANTESLRPWREDTVSQIWSCTKALSALAIATLVNKGLLNYQHKIHQHWPEFAQNGKENITVEMLLSHQAGLNTLGLPAGKSVSLLEYKNEWPKLEKMMAAAPPDFEPGSRLVYQAYTFGMYVDALIRRVDPKHRNLTQYFDEEIAKPFGIDVSIGLPLHQYYRAATQYPFASIHIIPLSKIFQPSYMQLIWTFITDRDSLILKSADVMDIVHRQVSVMNDPLLLEVGLGSITGVGAANGMAKLYDVLVSGGSGGKHFLPMSMVDMFTVPITESLPSDIDAPAAVFSQGFQVTKNVVGGKIIGHNGYGGQQAFADPDNQLGMSYITNFLKKDLFFPPDHFQELQRVFYDCFNKDKTVN